MSGLPNPDTLTRQPGAPSVGGADPDEITPEQAVEEARQAREAAERDARAAREQTAAAQRERDEARARATDAGSQAWTAQEQAVEQSITAQMAVAEQAKVAIANAQAAGDHVAFADALDKLTEARTALRDLGNRKAWVAQQKAHPQAPWPPQRQQESPRQQPQDSGIEVTTPGGAMRVSSQVKQWMDEHPRFYNDATFYNFAVAAAQTATADGMQEGSPAYFRHISSEMQKFEQYEASQQRGEPHAGNEGMNSQPPRSAAPQRRASSMGAPVSRSSAPATNANGSVDPLRIAQRFGGSVTVEDLREMGRIAGFMKNPQDEAGFQQYLKAQEEIYQIERAGGDTGLRADQVYR